MKIRKNDLEWIAGLLEGEGSFTHKSSGTDRNVVVSCHMTDLDVLQKLKIKIGSGNVNGPYANSKPEHKLRYMYQLCGRDAYLLMKMLRPLMGSRRSSRIDHLTKAYDDTPIKTYRIQNIDTKRIESTTSIKAWMKSKRMNKGSSSLLWETLSGKRNHYKRWKRLS